MKIEKLPDRVVATAKTVSVPSGFTLIVFLTAWNVIAGQSLTKALAARSWPLATSSLAGIGVATLIIGGFALFALGHQRLSLSPDGFANDWVVIWPVRRRKVSFAQIRSFEILTKHTDESISTYLRIHTAKRTVDWTLFLGNSDPSSLSHELKIIMRELKSSHS